MQHPADVISSSDYIKKVHRINRLRKIEAFIHYQMSASVVKRTPNRLGLLMGRLNRITFAIILAEKEL
jgi:hypothetical protein